MKSALPPILMVDDEPNMRATVSELLMDDGYTVDVAESGEHAVEMLTEPNSEYFMNIAMWIDLHCFYRDITNS